MTVYFPKLTLQPLRLRKKYRDEPEEKVALQTKGQISFERISVTDLLCIAVFIGIVLDDVHNDLRGPPD